MPIIQSEGNWQEAEDKALQFIEIFARERGWDKKSRYEKPTAKCIRCGGEDKFYGNICPTCIAEPHYTPDVLLRCPNCERVFPLDGGCPDFCPMCCVMFEEPDVLAAEEGCPYC